jgi:adenylylsulfate kinase
MNTDVYYNDNLNIQSKSSQRCMATKNHPIYWITGQSGAGKTTLAYALQKKIGGIVLDGDEMRASISLGDGFSRKAREAHNLRVARLAHILSQQTKVIISVIAPFRSTRAKVSELIDPVWIYVAKTLPKSVRRPYEIPRKPNITVNSDTQTLTDKVRIILEYIHRNK